MQGGGQRMDWDAGHKGSTCLLERITPADQVLPHAAAGNAPHKACEGEFPVSAGVRSNLRAHAYKNGTDAKVAVCRAKEGRYPLM